MWTEEKLDALLCEPSAALADDVKKIRGDIMVLGAGGKMGPSLSLLARNAVKVAGSEQRVIAVSRFTDPFAVRLLHDGGVETISADLLDRQALNGLPEVENIIYMAGRKFGTQGQEWLTWAMNSTLPAFVAEKFQRSNILVFSSGNIYPQVPVQSDGCTEADAPGPVGEYAMSCLARERAFEYAANQYGTNVLLYRLNYAIDLRYGVLCDIAEKLLAGQPISLQVPAFNCIWQKDANEIAIRGLLHCASPAFRLNVTGPEKVSVRYAAERMAGTLGVAPLFERDPGSTALLSNPSKSIELFGKPNVSAEKLMDWQAQWFLSGGRRLNKPTHFEEEKGVY